VIHLINKTIRIGSESLILKRVSYKGFRKGNPRKKGKHITRIKEIG
jgi:hypothetical protein